MASGENTNESWFGRHTWTVKSSYLRAR